MHGCSLCVLSRAFSFSHLLAHYLCCLARTHHLQQQSTPTGGQDNKVEHNLLLQQISTVDENGQPVVKGTKVSRGYYADNGPPTTLSGTGEGTDRPTAAERTSLSFC
jgi:hypothetical protein